MSKLPSGNNAERARARLSRGLQRVVREVFGGKPTAWDGPANVASRTEWVPYHYVVDENGPGVQPGPGSQCIFKTSNQ